MNVNQTIKTRVVAHHFTGPAQYHHGGVVNFVDIPGLRGIYNVDGVRMWAEGLIVEPQTVLGRRVTYLVKAAVSAHTHDIISKNGKGATAVKVAANVFRVNTAGGDNVIAGASAANGGIQNIAAAPAALADNQGIALPDDTVLNATTIYVTAVGY